MKVSAFQHALSLYALAGELRATDPFGSDMAVELGDRVYPAMLPAARAWRATIVRDHGGDVAAAARAEMGRRGVAVQRIGSLFSGIGGIELGLESIGVGETSWQCESDPYARAVLAKHWPTVPIFEDVRAVGADAPRVDIICGGFPCQDISNAGKRVGIRGARSGLWSEFARIVGVLRPRYVFIENVAALIVRGLDRVLADLAALGFDAEWDCFRASDVGAPHKRERLFILASDASGPRLEGRIEPNATRGPLAVSARVPWWDTEPPFPRVVDGISGHAHRIRMLGNAVVPQVAALAWQTLSARSAP